MDESEYDFISRLTTSTKRKKDKLTLSDDILDSAYRQT